MPSFSCTSLTQVRIVLGKCTNKYISDSHIIYVSVVSNKKYCLKVLLKYSPGHHFFDILVHHDAGLNSFYSHGFPRR